MSYYSRLAVATRGYRGGAGQSLYISQSFTIEDTDLIQAQVIEETLDIGVSQDIINFDVSVLSSPTITASLDYETIIIDISEE